MGNALGRIDIAGSVVVLLPLALTLVLACTLLLLAQPLALSPLVLAGCKPYASGCGSILRYFFAAVPTHSGIAFNTLFVISSQPICHHRC